MKVTRASALLTGAEVAVREAALFGMDLVLSVAGRRDPLVPPLRLMFDGPRGIEEFKRNGEEFLKLFVEVGELRPDQSVLDVGCGIGRKTVPLMRYLSPRGRYEGMDIVRAGIDWCQKNLTTRKSNFRFQHVDVFNGHYNPAGSIRDVDFRFPFADDTFDLVILTSVFTHMLPAAVDHYLGEIARVLRPEGNSFITYFLLNPEAIKLVDAGAADFRLMVRGEHYRAEKADDLEAVIAFDESYVADRYERHGLRPDMRYGRWCGRSNGTSYQDIVIGRRLG